MRRLISVALTVSFAISATFHLCAQQTGSLVFDLKNYTSSAKLPKKTQKTLEHAGVRWSMLENTLVISFINEKFVKTDLSNLNRFGEQKRIVLSPGRYTITCIGMEFKSATNDVEKFLAKSAYFNNDVLAFSVEAGKTTTLEVSPVYAAESQYRFLTKLTMFVPDLKVRALVDGVPQGEEVIVSRRTDKSVAWNDYHGPLKF